MARYDAVIVGSGINSLAAGALLAKGGWRVCILERNDWLGGAIRTAEITRPGFVHEVFASWHALFAGSAVYAELKDDLHARGLDPSGVGHWRHYQAPLEWVQPVLERWIKRLERDG